MANPNISIEEIENFLMETTSSPTLKRWLSEPRLSLEEVRNIVAKHTNNTMSNGQAKEDTYLSNGQS
jgi:hypothetical protein